MLVIFYQVGHFDSYKQCLLIQTQLYFKSISFTVFKEFNYLAHILFTIFNYIEYIQSHTTVDIQTKASPTLN